MAATGDFPAMSVVKNGAKGGKAKKWATVGLLGCFSMASLAMIVLVALAFLVPRAVKRTVEAYTDTEPLTFEAPDMDVAGSDALHDRLERFEESIDDGRDAAMLALSEDEVNLLLLELADEEGFDGSFQVDLLDGQVAVHMSVPLNKEFSIGPWEQDLRGRYLNGVATFDVGIEDGNLEFDLVSFDVKDRSAPGWALELGRDFIEESGVLQSEEVLEATHKLERLSVHEDRVVLRSAAG